MAAAPQNPAQAIDVMGPITVAHVTLLVALAVAALLVIWWGTVLRVRRKRADKDVAAHFEAAVEHGATADPAPATATTAGAAPGSVPVSADVPQPAASVAGATDLAQIKGLGPKLVTLLAERGITRVEQLAALDPAAAAALDAELGPFSGRMARDRWVEQAKLLAAGDRAGYEAAFGKL